MPTRRGRASFEADVGREPEEGEDVTAGEGGQPSGETEGYGRNHGEDRDRSGARGGSVANGG